ncbi:protein crumbs-like [Saccostrea echinata]|uniref:protein crumbs-like n=1 Tax=Saccostrea echinata TaxID=191078 RepID=UPI002A82C61B|nr:protein crumbs-like [Saccostrea echinata]
MKMWSIQMLLFSFALFMQFQFSSAQILFGNCTTNNDCVPQSTCVVADAQCQCNTGYFPQDAPAGVDGLPLTLCIPAPCNPLADDACGKNGECVVEIGAIYCNCEAGYTGITCGSSTMTTTTMSTTTTSTTTRRRFRGGPLIIGGGAGLLTLAALAAALASSSG